MTFPQAKPVDELYAAVAEYDLVLVSDAPLASALNRRLDRPHLGAFATTPRRIAAGRRETAEDRTAFLALVEQTDIDWKRAAHAIGDVLQCWEHQGSLDAILAYDEAIDDATRAAVDALADLDTTSKRLTEHRIDPDADVAVVGESLFTTLECSILPDNYDTVSPFTTAAFDAPPFRVFDTATAIVETVVDAAVENNPEDIAVVLDDGSTYSTLVESALEAADVPFYGGPGFADHPDHRAFLQFCRALHAGSDTRVAEVRPVLARLGIDLPVDHDQKRLRDLRDLRDVADSRTADDEPRALEWFLALANAPDDHSLADLLGLFERRAGVPLDSFRDELGRLSIADEPATEATIDRLAFYLSTYEVPVDRENAGVLLADAKSAAFVDRPTVFYLGMDDAWTHGAPRRPWVDRDAQFTRNFDAFRLLLQSGVTQHYLVQNARGGSPVTPCLYFEELFDHEYEQFTDLDSVRYGRPRGGGRRESEGDDAPPGSTPGILDRTNRGRTNRGRTNRRKTNPDRGDAEPPFTDTLASVETVSQSALNTYANSPRDYFFDRLLDQPDRDYFAEGTLFHDFAEVYATHPDRIDDATLATVVDFMVDHTRPFIRDVDRAARRTRYRIGLETLVTYLDEVAPSDTSFLPPAEGFGENLVAERLDLAVDSPVTERWFEDPDLGVKGLIDLVSGPTHLVDFKSGRRKRATKVVADSNIEDPSDTPNFQAKLYLAYWRTQVPDSELTFTFVHFLETLDEVVTGELDLDAADVAAGDLDDALTSVTYYPTTFEAHVGTESTFESLREDGAGACRKTLGKASYADYAAAFDDVTLPNTADSDELIESPFGEALKRRLREAVGDYAYVERGADQILREFARINGRNYFKPDLNAFESFLDDRIAELDRRHRGIDRFPVEGLAGEPNERYLGHRDLLMGGGR